MDLSKQENKYLSRKWITCCLCMAGYFWLKRHNIVADPYFTILQLITLFFAVCGTLADKFISKVHFGADGGTVEISDDSKSKA